MAILGEEKMDLAAFQKKKNNPWFETDIVWLNVLVFATLNILAVYAVPEILLFRIKWQTCLFTIFLHYLGMIGSVAGAHRLFSHRAFKATTALKILLILGNSVTAQPGVWRWARDHRVHHKFSDTMADPYNSRRGFFFAHCGWVMLRRHPATVEKWGTIDMSDLNGDPYVLFQKRHEALHYLIFGILLPIFIPIYGWNETFITSVIVPVAFRTACGWHCMGLINSWCHYFGNKPYDKTMYPTQSFIVSHLTLGEGWHNYHHTFPYDYKASELGFHYNPMTTFINVCARMGLAYDLRTVSDDVIKARMARTGDGTHAH